MGSKKVRMAVVFDTETTSLIANHTVKLETQGEIIEFYGALVDLSNGKVHDELYHLIKPRRKLSDRPNLGDKKTTTQITGITNEMLADKPSFKEVSESIRNFLEKAPLIIAHNVSFDMEMIDIEMERIGVKMNWPKPLCTVEATAYIKGGRMNQEKLYAYLFPGPYKEQHRAKEDTQDLIKVCVELTKRGII